jgi:hypothetical protein
MVDEEEYVNGDYVEEGQEEEQGGRDVRRRMMKRRVTTMTCTTAMKVTRNGWTSQSHNEKLSLRDGMPERTSNKKLC